MTQSKGIEENVYVIPSEVHLANPYCPHCGTDVDPDIIQFVEETVQNTSLEVPSELLENPSMASSIIMLGELNSCNICLKPFFIIEYPILDVDRPVLTKWTLAAN